MATSSSDSTAIVPTSSDIVPVATYNIGTPSENGTDMVESDMSLDSLTISMITNNLKQIVNTTNVYTSGTTKDADLRKQCQEFEAAMTQKFQRVVPPARE